MLLGHIFEFGLGTLQKAFARDATAADGDYALVDVVTRSPQVLLDAQGDLDARLLMRFQHLVKRDVHHEHKHH